MKKIIEMLLPIMLLGLSCLTPVKCDKNWITYLPDSQKLNTLALIGTHDTATYGTSLLYARTQSMDITKQLEAGIRVFDMRVRRTNNAFAMHHDLIYLGMMFGDLVREVTAYLQIHPQEFVIMLMQEEYKAEDSTMSACEILESRYIKRWLVQHWSIDDTVGQHRGQILLARGNRGFWGCVTQMPCKEQNNYEFNADYRRPEKTRDIKQLQAEVSETPHNHQCYINYLSANGGAMYSPISIALDRWELPRPLNGGIVTAPGMNQLMVEEFSNPRNTLYIVMADFPTHTLIDKVVDSNN